MSHVTSLLCENFKILKVVRFKPTKGVNKVTGKNAQGKSTLLDAVQALLGGAKYLPDRPIREGQDESKIVGELSDGIKITRTWSKEDGDKFYIEKIGEKGRLKKPGEIISELIGADPAIAFDPVAFTNMKPADQADLLRQITGLDTTELDAEYDRVYEERTAIGRDVKALQGKIAGEEEPEVVADPGPEIDISAFLTQIEAATQTQAKHDAARKQLKDVQVAIEDKCEELSIIERTYEAKRDEIKQLREREAKGLLIVAKLVDPDVSAIKAAVDEAKATNKKGADLRERRSEAIRKQNELDQRRQELKDKEQTQADQTSRLEDIDREKAKKLAACKMPVAGLGVERKHVVYNGVPFSQASSMQQIRVGLAIAASLNPKLRVVLVREGSLLDEDALADVAKWAEENDVQVFLELVGSGRGGLELVDGEAKK